MELGPTSSAVVNLLGSEGRFGFTEDGSTGADVAFTGAVTKATDAAKTAGQQRVANADAGINGGHLTDQQAMQAAAALRASVPATSTAIDDDGKPLGALLQGVANGYAGLAADTDITDRQFSGSIGSMADALGADVKFNLVPRGQQLADQKTSIVERMKTASPAEQNALARQWADTNSAEQANWKEIERELDMQDLLMQLLMESPSPETIKRLKKAGLGKLVDQMIAAFIARERNKHGSVPPGAAAALAAAGYGAQVGPDLAAHQSKAAKLQADPRHWKVLDDGSIVPYVPIEDADPRLAAQQKNGTASGLAPGAFVPGAPAATGDGSGGATPGAAPAAGQATATNGAPTSAVAGAAGARTGVTLLGT